MSALAEQDARDAVRTFIVDYALAMRTVGTPGDSGSAPAQMPPSEFSVADQESLLSIVLRYFLPWQNGADARFASASAFGQAFGTTSGGDFADLAVNAAKLNVSPVGVGCEELVRRGVATPHVVN